MGRISGIFLVWLMFTFLSTPIIAQKTFFEITPSPEVAGLAGKRVIIPEKFKAFTLEKNELKSFLISLPVETAITNRKVTPVITLPMPDGSMARFNVWNSPVMDPALAAKYPDIQTFAGQGIDDPYATVRFDYNPYFGFSAEILSIKGNVFIDPYSKGSDIDHYQSYYARDYKKTVSWNCIIPDNVPATTNIANRLLAGPCRGTELFTYRLALACTGEYAQVFLNGTETTDAQRKAKVLAGMTTSINRVNAVYEKEIAVRLILIGNTDLLIYLNGGSDPYTNNNGTTMLTENQNNVDAVIGNSNYDIGHVFSTGGGGIAGVAVVCNNTQKARGVTGLPNPTGDAFDIDFVAHEMGHQFGAQHSFNGTGDLCNGSRNASSAYEPGSGTTIMAYAGTCASDNLQPNSDPYFHAISFDEISTYLQGGGSCRGVIATGNILPVIIGPLQNNNVSIPIGTPFTLTGSATDANGDGLTYSWEEWDLGDAGSWNSGANSTTAPLFKSRTPKMTGERTFPDIAVILAGYPVSPAATMGGLKGEVLPQVARAMKFRLTVRDNRASGGGVVSSGSGCQSATVFQINVVGASPFKVTYPDAAGTTFTGNSSQTITWNVVGTSAAPISCANVKISLSTDGGLTYPTVITASTPNDGTETLIIPNLPSTTARIKIEAVGNIFFDISNNNFTITPALTGFDFTYPPIYNIPCDGSTTAAITLGSIPISGFSTPINLSASNVPTGATVSFAPNPLVPGNSTSVTLSGINNLTFGTYTISVTGVVGAITRTRDIVFVVAKPTVSLVISPPAPLPEIQPGDSVKLKADIVSFSAGFNVSWFKNGIEISGATDTTLFVNISGLGTYKVKVTHLASGCSTESNTITITAKASERLFVFPSPNDGQFTVSYYNSAGANTRQSISVFDSKGQMVYNAQKNITSQYTLHSIDLRGKARGLYIVVIGDANGKKLKQEKVVIY